jgi:hypothetical protein
LALLALIAAGGCTSGGSEPKPKTEQDREAERAKSAESIQKSLVGEKHQISIQELDQLSYNFADRYYMVISSAVDALKRDNPDPTQRRIAHQIELNGVLSMNDIVSGNDPYAQIFDLVVSVTLQSRVWIDENRAEQVFGDRAPGLIKAMYTMRVEAWKLAEKVLTQDQLERLDYIILEWRRTHPEIDQVAYVKFDNFAGARTSGLLSELEAGSGFLAPLSETSHVLKDWGRLSERAFWYSKRAPHVAAIQAEGAVNEILAAPEINSVLQTSERVGKTVESTPKLLDAQRQAIFADLDARQAALNSTIAEARRAIADTEALGRTATQLNASIQQTLGALDTTLKTADGVGRTFGLDKPSPRPFNIEEYTAALTKLNEVVVNAQKLTAHADAITQSEGWKKAMQDMTDAADRRVDRIFVRLCLLLGLAFVLAVTYRVISLRLARPPTPPRQEVSP